MMVCSKEDYYQNMKTKGIFKYGNFWKELCIELYVDTYIPFQLGLR